MIEAVLGENRDSELERAREVWRKKFGSTPTDAAEKARQMRFLQSRGFTPEVIRRAIGG
jgi:regulatory protein